MSFLFLRRDDIHEYKVPSKEIDNLTGSHQPKKIYIVESRSGSHNIVREPDQPLLTKSENCPTLVIGCEELRGKVSFYLCGNPLHKCTSLTC
jgi:hypothetical protein